MMVTSTRLEIKGYESAPVVLSGIGLGTLDPVPVPKAEDVASSVGVWHSGGF